MPSCFLRAAIFAVVTVGASLAHAQQAQPGLFESIGGLFKPADSRAASEEKPAPATPNLSAVIPQGERRVALVIGNNAYRHVKPLDNAVADAKAMAREFRALGFRFASTLPIAGAAEFTDAAGVPGSIHGPS
ncbi:MAG: caspase family protein [Sulfuritalea sp.]|nr:caspase family protein [Sulfuritalea sp.]